MGEAKRKNSPNKTTPKTTSTWKRHKTKECVPDCYYCKMEKQ